MCSYVLICAHIRSYALICGKKHSVLICTHMHSYTLICTHTYAIICTSISAGKTLRWGLQFQLSRSVGNGELKREQHVGVLKLVAARGQLLGGGTVLRTNVGVRYITTVDSLTPHRRFATPCFIHMQHTTFPHLFAVQNRVAISPLIFLGFAQDSCVKTPLKYTQCGGVTGRLQLPTLLVKSATQ